MKRLRPSNHTKRREPKDLHDRPETSPVDGVECFSEVELQDLRGSTPLVAALGHLSSIDEILHDASSSDEPRLVLIDNPADLPLETRRESSA